MQIRTVEAIDSMFEQNIDVLVFQARINKIYIFYQRLMVTNYIAST
jgi:hypothetical protein